ncbi:MAG: aldehyde ferredoxin oxidoreductase N-terminal domain-containing protein [Actinomycetota bacterium]
MVDRCRPSPTAISSSDSPRPIPTSIQTRSCRHRRRPAMIQSSTGRLPRALPGHHGRTVATTGGACPSSRHGSAVPRQPLLFFLTGPLTGSMVTGSSKFVVVAKSPLTHTWCDAYSSGRISVQLKRVGYDGMVIRGWANDPCYLRVDDTGVDIRDARHLWGQDSFTTEAMLKDQEGEGAAVGVSSIGPAGENLVKFACINSDLYRQAGRGGVGAVMGSKRLKAIVVAGG